jgi:hypothetical protein
MVSGSLLRDFYIDVWRRTPGLVAAMGGDEGLIRPSNALAHVSTSLARTVQGMGAPMIYVAYQGYKYGSNRHSETTRHLVTAYIRAASPDDDDHIEFGALMVDGRASGEELRTRYLTPHLDCDPMEMPVFARAGAATLDFDIWELQIVIPEHFSSSFGDE